jgi:hypothetical protein
VLHRGAFYKSDLSIVDAPDGRIVLKDYAGKAWWIRWLIGWAQIEWESRAYEAVNDLDCVPTFRGRVDRTSLALDWIEGSCLCAAPDRRASARRYLRELRGITEAFLARGFLHLDFRGIRNVLVRPDGSLVVVDLAGSVWVKPGSRLHRLLIPWMRGIYRGGLLKWRRVLTAEVAYRDQRRWWYKILFWLRQPHKVVEASSTMTRLRRERRRRREFAARPNTGADAHALPSRDEV